MIRECGAILRLCAARACKCLMFLLKKIVDRLFETNAWRDNFCEPENKIVIRPVWRITSKELMHQESRSFQPLWRSARMALQHYVGT
jgi:hypothetical protein